MNLYLIGIIIFIIILVISIIGLIYFINDEKKLLEVSTEELLKYGKTYNKQEFENKLFEIYTNILMNKTYENYSYLKDAISDEEYNKFLLEMKNNKENNIQNVVSDISKEFARLISFQIVNDLEIAKIWVRYSDIEYSKGIRKTVNEDGSEVLSEVVISGDINKRNNWEYIITFVRNRTNTEEVICPGCGYQTNILTSSKCIRCDNEIIPKKMHWVYIDRVTTNISKAK